MYQSLKRPRGLLGLIALGILLIWPGCKPTPQFELLQELTDQQWQLVSLDITYDYEIEESYILPSTGSFRKITQQGSLELSYSSGAKIWQADYLYTRNQETSSGPLPPEIVRKDTNYTGLGGVWEFRTDNLDSPDGLLQRYYDEQQDCQRVFSQTGVWDILTQTDDQGLYVEPVIEMELAHLFTDRYAGGIVFYPGIFDASGFLDIPVHMTVSGESLVIEKYPEFDLPLRSDSFNTPDYGDVDVQEKYRSLYVRIALRKIDDNPCEPAGEKCGPNSIPCVNGTIGEDAEGFCRCNCEPGWEGPACDQQVLLSTWVDLGAGTGAPGLLDSAAAQASFSAPFDIQAHSGGNLYIADRSNHAIRLLRASDNRVITLAGGNGAGHHDGPGTTAAFNRPSGLAVGPDGTVYVCDHANHCIRQIDPDGTVSTLAGEPGQQGFQHGSFQSARLHAPNRILYDADVLRGHPVLLVSEGGSSTILLLDLSSREVEVYAGARSSGLEYRNGAASQAAFSNPNGLALARDGTLYIADRNNHAIRSVANDADRTVATYAGTLPDRQRTRVVAANRKFNLPSGLALGPDGALYIGDERNHAIRRIRHINGLPFEEQVAGDPALESAGYVNGAPSTARFNEPSGMVFVGNMLYVAEVMNNRIRRVHFQ